VLEEGLGLPPDEQAFFVDETLKGGDVRASTPEIAGRGGVGNPLRPKASR
jgi:hypothetical protein